MQETSAKHSAALNNNLQELKILEHVETSPLLTNRMLARKLGCSVKLAHKLLGKMVDRGCLHVKKIHSRRWDYFLTPKGLAEKARLTYEFLQFSMQFYKEARKRSAQLCRDLAESGIRRVVLLGAGDLAEIVYLGCKEWNLEITAIYDNKHKTFLGKKVQPFAEFAPDAPAAIVCFYAPEAPMLEPPLPDNIKPSNKIHWIFNEKYNLQQHG
ncbi:hypothetical protein P0136_00050 [Lentisphaerota bacterium ZTH]|nr:hypothetical protein JYG24_08805 [Lentisphaerota bacterium]WET06408.1 hypothetical protein P0136_00050 [Lentisphaerota bacterium ZTH]